jgi:hypothetical protein
MTTIPSSESPPSPAQIEKLARNVVATYDDPHLSPVAVERAIGMLRKSLNLPSTGHCDTITVDVTQQSINGTPTASHSDITTGPAGAALPPIPAGVFYDAEDDRFCEADSLSSMGVPFWGQWRGRASEFPTSADEALMTIPARKCWGRARDEEFRESELDDFLSAVTNDDLKPGDTIYCARTTPGGIVTDITPYLLSASNFDADDERVTTSAAEGTDTDRSDNAPWLTLAHTICADAGIEPGPIMDRLATLRDLLDAALRGPTIAAEGDTDAVLAEKAAMFDYVCATTTAIRDADTGERIECTPELFVRAIKQGMARVAGTANGAQPADAAPVVSGQPNITQITDALDQHWLSGSILERIKYLVECAAPTSGTAPPQDADEPRYTLDEIANACAECDVPDSRYESIALALVANQRALTPDAAHNDEGM